MTPGIVRHKKQGEFSYAGEAGTLDAQDIAKLNDELVSAGETPVPEDTVRVGLDESGAIVADQSDGSQVVLKSNEEMDSEESASLTSYNGEEQGVVTVLASMIGACVGGVIGFDEIVDILNRRVSYWTLARFLARRVGIGIAISCIASAGGALAAHMGW